MVTVAFNPSTLKVLMSSASPLVCTSCCTIKPPLPDPNRQNAACTHCGAPFPGSTQPIKLRVLFEDFVDFTGCARYDGPLPCRCYVFPAGSAALLNGYHILDYLGPSSPFQCIYRKVIPVNISVNVWCAEECDDEVDLVLTATFMRITATGTAGGVSFLCQYIDGTGVVSSVFFGSLVYGGGESCFGTVAQAANTVVGGPCATTGCSEPFPGTIATGTMAALEI